MKKVKISLTATFSIKNGIIAKFEKMCIGVTDE